MDPIDTVRKLTIDTVRKLTIPILDVRAGDVFTRHRRTWTARHDAHKRGQFTVSVETVGGGVVYASVNDTITVTRDTKGLRCDDASV